RKDRVYITMPLVRVPDASYEIETLWEGLKKTQIAEAIPQDYQDHFKARDHAHFLIATYRRYVSMLEDGFVMLCRKSATTVLNHTDVKLCIDVLEKNAAEKNYVEGIMRQLHGRNKSGVNIEKKKEDVNKNDEAKSDPEMAGKIPLGPI